MFKNKNKKILIESIPTQHGKIGSICYIINKKLAYASDINGIQNKYHKYFKNLNFLVIDCLRIKKHPSHYNLFEVLELIKFFKPKKAILTNMHSDLDYKYLLKILPKNILPGYDGITLNI